MGARTASQDELLQGRGRAGVAGELEELAVDGAGLRLAEGEQAVEDEPALLFPGHGRRGLGKEAVQKALGQGDRDVGKEVARAVLVDGPDEVPETGDVEGCQGRGRELA